MMDQESEGEGELDPRDELASLVRSLREHLLWQGSLGTTGLPRDPDAKQRVQADYAALGASPGRPSIDESTLESRRSPPQPVATATAEIVPRASPRVDEASAPVPQKPKALPLLPTDLGELATMVKSCSACALHAGRTQTVFSRGTGTSRLVFVGEAPGEEEESAGAPFVGPAGQLLDRMIDAMGFSLDEVYVANIVKCRPPEDRAPNAAEIAKCRPYLEAQLAALQPECVVALGAAALTALFGPNEGIKKARGRFRTFGTDIVVMPTYHPAYLLRVPTAKKEVWADLVQVVRAMGRTPKAR